MTEAGWLACQHPYALLYWANGRTAARKLRLIAAAACRAATLDPAPADAVPADRWLDSFDRAADSGDVGEMDDDPPWTGRWDSPLALACLAMTGLAEGPRCPRSAQLVREIVGNPFRRSDIAPAWLTPTVVSLSHAAF